MPSAATATRAAPIGTGPLHCALEDARDRAYLQELCRAVGCIPADVSSDGIRIDMLRVFDLMRQRGYLVSDPTRPQAQPRAQRKHRTTWLVNVTLPASGASFVWAFEVPNTS